MQYPDCHLTERYPILSRIPPEDRAGWVSQAESGIPLTAEQSMALGLHPSLVGGLLLLPAVPRHMTDVQLNALCPPDNRKVLKEVLALGLRGDQHGTAA